MPEVVRPRHLYPERSPLSDRRELRGLEVGESEGGEVRVLGCEHGKARNDERELVEYEGQRVPEEDEVRIAGLEMYSQTPHWGSM
jgi:hypothetical protein